MRCVIRLHVEEPGPVANRVLTELAHDLGVQELPVDDDGNVLLEFYTLSERDAVRAVRNALGHAGDRSGRFVRMATPEPP